MVQQEDLLRRSRDHIKDNVSEREMKRVVLKGRFFNPTMRIYPERPLGRNHPKLPAEQKSFCNLDNRGGLTRNIRARRFQAELPDVT